MAEKLGESFVLLVLRDAAFRASLKADEKFAEAATAKINATLAKVNLGQVPVSFDTKHLQKSAAVVEAIVGVSAERWRKLTRIPAYVDVRPLRKSLKVFGNDVTTAMSAISGRARVKAQIDTRGFQHSISKAMSSYQSFLSTASGKAISPLVGAPRVSAGQMPGGAIGRGPGGGGGGGGLGLGGSLLAGAAGGLAADMGVRAFGKAKASLESLLQTGMATNAKMEVLGQSFETMMGSATAGQRVLESLRKFAELTPFELPDVAKVGVQLVATKKIAENQLIPTIQKIGDAAAGSADGFDSFPRIARAVSQMLNKEKVQAEEMLQLAEAGVPAWTALSKAMGKTVPELQKMGERGQLGLDAVMKLIDGLGGQFDGLAAKQSKTFQGLESTWRDQLAQAMAKVTKPLFELKRMGLGFLTEWMNTAQARRFLDTLTDGMASVADQAKGVGGRLLEWAKNADISGITRSVGKFLGLVGKAATMLIDAFQNPIVRAVAKFAALSAGVSAFMAIATMIGPTLLAAFAPVSLVAAGVATAMATVGSSIKTALEGDAGKQLRETLSVIWDRVQSIGANLKDNLIPILESVSEKFSNLIPEGGISGLWAGAAETLDGLLKKVQVLTTDFGATWEYAKAIGAATILDWWNRLKHMLTEQAPAAFMGFGEGMWATAKAFVDGFWELLQKLFQRAAEAFKGVFSLEGTLLGKAGKEIKGAWGDVGDTMLEAQKRAKAAAEATKKTGGSQADSWLAAGAEIAMGIEKSLGRYGSAGVKIAGDATGVRAQQAGVLAQAASGMAADVLELERKKADAFAAAFQQRMAGVPGAGTDPAAEAERKRAAEIWDRMQGKSDKVTKDRDVASKVKAAKEREEAGAKGLEKLLGVAKTGLASWWEQASQAARDLVTNAETPGAGKGSGYETTTTSGLYAKVAESLMGGKISPHERKMEDLTQSIRDILSKVVGKPLVNAAAGVPKKLADGAFKFGDAVGKLFGDLASGAGVGNPIKGAANAARGAGGVLRDAAGWLSSQLGQLPIANIDEATKEAIRHQQLLDMAKSIPDLFGPETQTAGQSAKQKLMDELKNGAATPKTAVQSAKQKLLDELKNGVAGPASVSNAIGDAMKWAESLMNPMPGESQGGEDKRLMIEQNQILQQSVKIQQAIVSGLSGLSLGYSA